MSARRESWREFYVAESNRPRCDQCLLPMMADPAPRLTGLKPVAPGAARTFWRCSWCWARKAVESPLDGAEVPDRD